MTDEHSPAAHSPDGLWRWLLGGLAGGAVVLGLLIAAYAIGYHRGERHTTSSTRTTAVAPPATTTTTTKPTTVTPVQVTPALVARGKALYTSDGCSACHSLSGTPGAGPSFKGLAGGTSALTTGETVTVDDAYLERSITDPDAQIVKGYHQGIMAPAVAGLGLSAKPDELRALVAFIKSVK